jgi:hypothetical protein
VVIRELCDGFFVGVRANFKEHGGEKFVLEFGEKRV